MYIPKGSLLVESTPGNQLPGFQNIPYLVKTPRQGPSGFPHSTATGSSQNTLAELQMQVEKLNPTTHWQDHPPWTSCRTVRLLRSSPETLHAPALSPKMATQLRCRLVVPPPSHTSLPRSLPNPEFMPQVSVQFIVCFHLTDRPSWTAEGIVLYRHDSLSILGSSHLCSSEWILVRDKLSTH